jgi:hypothetical protein
MVDCEISKSHEESLYNSMAVVEVWIKAFGAEEVWISSCCTRLRVARAPALQCSTCSKSPVSRRFDLKLPYDQVRLEVGSFLTSILGSE